MAPEHRRFLDHAAEAFFEISTPFLDDPFAARKLQNNAEAFNDFCSKIDPNYDTILNKLIKGRYDANSKFLII
jgi:hypothetical protein